MKRFAGYVFVFMLALTGCAPVARREAPATSTIPDSWEFHQIPAPITGSRGMVASDGPLASEAGVQIMRDGGNAVDAAVATAFALAVVLPEAGNIGGGGFMVVRMADGTTAALDFREKAPLAASRNMYLDANGDLTDRSINGHLAAGVPGSVAGLWEAHKRFGRLPWRAVVEPAIRLASDGFIVTKDLAESVRDDSARLARWPGSAELFLPGGKPLQAGSLWRNPDLAATLHLIATEGPQGFYGGTTAELIVGEMRRGNGIITKDDLARYTAVWRTPITATYRNHTIISMPPPSSGGTTIALMAHMLEPYDMRSMGWHTPEGIHLTVEVMRRAFADRNHWFGDPDFVQVPLERLLSQEYAETRASTIIPDKATPSARVSSGPAGEVREPMHTTHYSVADSAGNMVAVTTTVNLGFGSAVTVRGAGFLLNNEMDDFATKPGSPNVFGLVQGEANAIAPEKRILSSMSPTIVLDPDGQPLMITGASGGPRIINAVFQVITNVVDHHMDIGPAVMAPRFHHQHLPDVILMENGGFTPGLIAGLAGMGHATRSIRHLAISASILRSNGVWRGAADPRIGGRAVGY